MKTAIVIPARYASQRLPAKPLLRETGKYLVQHVYEQACRATRSSDVVVATDDARIVAAVESFGGKVCARCGSPNTYLVSLPDEQGGSVYICSDSSWCDAALERGARGEGRGASEEASSFSPLTPRPSPLDQGAPASIQARSS